MTENGVRAKVKTMSPATRVQEMINLSLCGQRRKHREGRI